MLPLRCLPSRGDLSGTRLETCAERAFSPSVRIMHMKVTFTLCSARVAAVAERPRLKMNKFFDFLQCRISGNFLLSRM